VGPIEREDWPSGIDLLIAATALENGCAIVTRNVRDFALTGVAIENPFEPR
jgi:toxin FitB